MGVQIYIRRGFIMSIYLQNEVDISPLVFPTKTKVEFTVQSLGTRLCLQGEYTVAVHRANAGSANEAFSAWNVTKINATTDDKHTLRFSYSADQECEYYVRLYQDNNMVCQLHVYAVDHDLACQIGRAHV